MKLSYDNPAELKNLFEIVNKYVDEVKIKIDSSGLSLKLPDRATVCIIELKIKPESFTKFEIDKPQDFGLNISNLVSILKNAGKKDTVIFETTDKEFIITFAGAYSRIFKIPLLDLAEETVPPTESLEFKVKETIEFSAMSQAIKEAYKLSDSLNFIRTENKLKFVADSDVSNYELILDSLSPITETFKSRYPLDYLLKLTSASKIFDTCTLNFANDYPLKIDFVKDGLSLTLVLAPKVSEE